MSEESEYSKGYRTGFSNGYDEGHTAGVDVGMGWGSKWQPIETAPRDGRFILARYNGGNWIYPVDPKNVYVRCVRWDSRCWREWGPSAFNDKDLSEWSFIPETPK